MTMTPLNAFSNFEMDNYKNYFAINPECVACLDQILHFMLNTIMESEHCKH